MAGLCACGGIRHAFTGLTSRKYCCADVCMVSNCTSFCVIASAIAVARTCFLTPSPSPCLPMQHVLSSMNQGHSRRSAVAIAALCFHSSAPPPMPAALPLWLPAPPPWYHHCLPQVLVHDRSSKRHHCVHHLHRHVRPGFQSFHVYEVCLRLASARVRRAEYSHRLHC